MGAFGKSRISDMRGGIREEWGDSFDSGVWLLAKSRFLLYN